MKLLESSCVGLKTLPGLVLLYSGGPTEILSSATMRACRIKDSGGEEDKGQSVTVSTVAYRSLGNPRELLEFMV